MTVEKIIRMDFIERTTRIFIRQDGASILAYGNWYQDNILDYREREVKSFTWQNHDEVWIDIFS